MNKIGKPPAPQRRNRTWVQTEKDAHEAWARLIAQAPQAARLAHVLVAHMDQGNAVVASQTTLGELMAVPGQKPVHRNTIRRAIQTLERERWIEVVQIGGKGGALAYIVNSRIAWSQKRENKCYAKFAATVLVSETEQHADIESRPPLREIPVLMRGEQQIPAGPGEDPPSQPSLNGMDPDLPAIVRDENGATWDIDPQTGEMQRRIDE